MIDAMKGLRIAAVIPLLAVSKCPVTSDSPIAPASSEVLDRRLSGKWRCLSPGEDSVIALTIEARTPTTLWVGYVERSKPDSMMLHSAKMAGRMLVNVRLGGDGDAWVLGRLRVLDPTVFRLDVLSADIPDTTSVARQKLIERAIRDDSFDDGFLCRRPTESRQ